MEKIPTLDELINRMIEVDKNAKLGELEELNETLTLVSDHLKKQCNRHESYISDYNLELQKHTKNGFPGILQMTLISLKENGIASKTINLACKVQAVNLMKVYAKTRIYEEFSTVKLVSKRNMHSPNVIALLEIPEKEPNECVFNFVDEVNFASYNPLAHEVLNDILGSQLAELNKKGINVYHVTTQSKRYPQLEFIQDLYNKLALDFQRANPAIAEQISFWADENGSFDNVGGKDCWETKKTKESRPYMYG